MAFLKKYLLLGCIFCSIHATAQRKQVQESLYNGNQSYIKGEYDQAIQSYESALNQESTNPVALYNTGNAYFKNGNLEAARLAYEQAIAHSDDKNLQQKAWYNLGVAYSKDKKLDESIVAYKEAIKLNPEDQEARHNLQKALQERMQKQPPPPPQNRQEKQQNQQPREQQSKLSKQDIERYLQSLEEREQAIRNRMKERIRKSSQQPEKDW